MLEFYIFRLVFLKIYSSLKQLVYIKMNRTHLDDLVFVWSILPHFPVSQPLHRFSTFAELFVISVSYLFTSDAACDRPYSIKIDLSSLADCC
jgi:hypothetical protein